MEMKTLVKYLVEHEADISMSNNEGKTPLFSACKKWKKKN